MTNELDEVMDDHAVRKSAVTGGLATAAAQGGRFLIRLASQIVIARLLLPSDYGLIAMVMPVLALVGLFGDLGLGQAIIQRADATRADVSAVFWIGLTVSCLMAVLLMALSPLIALMYGEPKLILLTICLAAMMPLGALYGTHVAMLTRGMRFGRLALVDIVPSVIGFGVGFAAASSGLGYWSLVVMSLAEALSSLILFWCLSSWRPSRPQLPPRIWSMVRVGGHFTGYNFANYLLTSADNILVGLFAGNVQLGLYAKGYQLVTQPIGQLAAPFSRVASPLLLRLRSDENRYRNIFIRMLQMMILASLPGLLVMTLFARPLVVGLLGPQWAAMSQVVAWLSFGGLASMVYASTYWLFFTQERSGELLRYTVYSSLLSLAGFAIGLPWGAVGVAAGAGLTFVLLCAPLMVWAATRSGPVTARNVVDAIIPLCLAGAITWLSLWSLRSQAFAIPVLVEVGIAFAGSYALFVAMLCLHRSGRSILIEIWSIRRLMRRSGDRPMTEDERRS